MQEIESESPEVDHLRCRQLRTSPGPVDIAANGSQWSDRAQFIEDRRIADIARMQNMVDAGQRGDRLRSKQAMRVGDDPNPHRLRARSTVLYEGRGSRVTRLRGS